MKSADTSPTSPPPAAAFLLPPSVDLTWADTLHGELQSRIAGDTGLVIDGAAVERVSTACLQLLAAAAVSAQQHGLIFRLTAPSGVLNTAIHDLGLAHALGMEEA